LTIPPDQGRAGAGFYWHLPITQTCDGSHCVPHEPQLVGEASRFAHVPAQFVVPAGQVQPPFWQMRLPAQTWLQNPQWILVFDKSAHVPTPPPPPAGGQRVNPDVHCTTHMLLLQSGVAAGHAVAHAPQLNRFDSRSTQFPTPPPPPAHCA
jgi:hypothetical protein